MPIIKDGTGTIVYTPKVNKWLSDYTGVQPDSDFAIADDLDQLKQLKFSTGAQSTNTSTTIATGAIASDVTITLPSVTATLAALTGTVNSQSSTTYTLASTDNGTILRSTSGSATTITLPNSLSVGFNVLIVQDGAGQITFSAGSGATLQNRVSQYKTAAIYAVVSLIVVENSGGSAARYILAGDVAA